MSFLHKLSMRPVFAGLTLALFLCTLSLNGLPLFAQETAESTTTVISEPIAEVISEPIAEVVSEPVAEVVSEPVAEVISEPIAEVVSEPVAEVIQETLPEVITSETLLLDEPTQESAEGELSKVDLVPITVEKVPFNWKESGFTTLFVFFLVVVGSILVANSCSKKWRMPDHNMRIFILLVCFFGSVAATYLGWSRLTLGIDLRGGVILVYDVHGKMVDQTEVGAPANENTEQGFDMEQLTKALGMRINPGGVREISITKLGTNQVKIIIPAAEDAEVARIQRVISESGALEFRILASRQFDMDKAIIDRAENEFGTIIYDTIEGKQIRRAFWVPVSDSERSSFERDTEIITRTRGEYLEVLVLVDKYNVLGKDIKGVREEPDRNQQPGLGFTLHPSGARRFYALTNENKVDPVQPNRVRRLGIIMNGQLYSAPRLESAISDRGIITFGQRNTAAERQALMQEIEHLMNVMNAGSLPADLSREPVSRLLTGATLGEDTINKGMYSIVLGGILVLAFMVLYYRIAGLVACFAVIMNLFMIMGVMLALRAAFTLPGLAGLLLTLGMAVDANILIFERIREELSNGVSLRMSIRNGFDRAFSAIIDSNLTTLVSGFILYWFGNEQIKGFAVTLILGVTFSMFTAIYCCRTIFDVLERRGWIKTLNMTRIFSKPNFDFLGKKRFCAVLSIALIIISLGATAFRGKGLLDIDFVGGVSAEVVFKESQEIEEIRNKLGKILPDLSVSNVQLDMPAAKVQEEVIDVVSQKNTHFIVNTSIKPEYRANPDDNLKFVVQTLKDQFSDKLVYNSIRYEIDEEASRAASGSTTLSNPASDLTGSSESTESPVTNPILAEKTVARLLTEPAMKELDLRSKLDAYMQQMIQDGKAKEAFDFVIEPIRTIASEPGMPKSHWDGVGDMVSRWNITLFAPQKDAEIFLNVAVDAAHEPFLPSSNTIGGAVAQQSQIQAILAIFASFICIIGYIWFRFQRLVFGLSAVIALIHDIIITLGCIAISAWLAPLLGFAGVYEFKVSLPVVAAFLAIIGYSLNDTIILFDRIREVRGKSPILTESLINTSINQTLSRTVLTSLSTLFVVAVLYFFGGQGIHAFAFTMLMGIVVGTYSSIYIASPILYWLVGVQTKMEQKK
ncbi:MAG: protein translocase subunit SecD [Thermoguttaceae bacterium]